MWGISEETRAMMSLLLWAESWPRLLAQSLPRKVQENHAADNLI